MACINTRRYSRLVIVSPHYGAVEPVAAVYIVKGIGKSALAAFADTVLYNVSGLYGFAVLIAVAAACAGISRVAVCRAGRSSHDGLVPVVGKLAVCVAAFIADRLVLAGGRTAAVRGFSADLVPLLVHCEARRLELIAQIFKGLSAALAAEPVIVIVAAMVNVLDFHGTDDIFHAESAAADHFDDIRGAHAELLGKLLEIIFTDVGKKACAGVQIVAGALVDEVLLGQEHGPLFVLVLVLAGRALVIIYRTVGGAGLGRALYELKVLTAAGALGSILRALFNERAAVGTVLIAGVALRCRGGLDGVFIFEIYVVIGVELTIGCAALGALCLVLAACRTAGVAACCRSLIADSALLIVDVCGRVGYPVVVMGSLGGRDLGMGSFCRTVCIRIIVIAAGAVSILDIAFRCAGSRFCYKVLNIRVIRFIFGHAVIELCVGY